MIIESCVTYKADTDTNKKNYESNGMIIDQISKTDSSCCEKWCFFVWYSHESCTKKIHPKPTSLTSKVLPDLATHTLISLGNFGMDKILGQGWYQNTSQRGGFLFPRNRIDQLAAHKNLLTKKQKEQILAALQNGGKPVINPTENERGGFLGTLLASIFIPLLLNALTGKDMQNRSRPPWSVPRTSLPRSQPSSSNQGRNCLQNRPNNMSMLYRPPPLIGSWENQTGMGTKKKTQSN